MVTKNGTVLENKGLCLSFSSRRILYEITVCLTDAFGICFFYLFLSSVSALSAILTISSSGTASGPYSKT